MNETTKRNTEFCRCKEVTTVYAETNDFGQWLVCDVCKKPIEDSFEYFNHYDGEDHITEY